MKRLICVLLSVFCLLPAVPGHAGSQELAAQGGILQSLGSPLKDKFPAGMGSVYARSVWDMTVFDGRIYIGCGNYLDGAGYFNGKTIPIMSYDPYAGAWQAEADLPDDQLSRFHTTQDALLIPGACPLNGGEKGSFYRLNSQGWQTVARVTAAKNTFDLQQQERTGFLFAGIGTNPGIPASVSLSTNGGKNFRMIYFKKQDTLINVNHFTALGQYDENYARSYNVFEYGGEIYATWWCAAPEIDALYGGLYRYNPNARVFEYVGQAPERYRSDLYLYARDLVFKETLVALNDEIYIFSDDLQSFRTFTGFEGNASDAEVIGDYLYFITYEKTEDGYRNRLYRTKDLSCCELLASFDLDFLVRSFCYCEGLFYLGTEADYAGQLADAGTVLTLALQAQNCAHDNLLTYDRPAQKGRPGEHAVRCVQCWHPLLEQANPFTDVVPGDWYYSSVLDLYERSLMAGTSGHTFSPAQGTTRAMMVQMLYRLAGMPEAEAPCPFEDVPAGAWYTRAVHWAYAEKIVAGVSAAQFAPDEPITREQLCAMLYQYARYQGLPVHQSADISRYSDFDEISAYALPALRWACASGYLYGLSDTVLAPKGGANRAQMAGIFARFTASPDEES